MGGAAGPVLARLRLAGAGDAHMSAASHVLASEE